jgi:hypothetical protein
MLLMIAGCSSSNNEEPMSQDELTFNHVTYSKIITMEQSIEKQLQEVNNRLLTSGPFTIDSKNRIEYLDSLSARISIIRDEVIHHAGGYKDGTAGLMYPLEREGVKSYFYYSNDYNSFAHKEIDDIVFSVNKKYAQYLECNVLDIFQVHKDKFFSSQEPDNTKPSDYLIKDKNAVEVILVLQTFQTQLEVLKLKIIENYTCQQ